MSKTKRLMEDWIYPLLILVACIGLVYFIRIRIKTEQKLIIKNPVEIRKAPYFNGVATITYYQATLEQCSSTAGIGASGQKMQIGDCAVAKWMIGSGFAFFDTITVVSGEFKGKYCIKDCSAAKGYHIDIFKSLDYKPTTGCYKSKFILNR